MTTNILSPNWEGDTAEPIDPTTIRFKAVRAPVYADCQGCLFIGQRSAVCRQASALAVEAGQVDCDDAAPEGWSVIYVIDKSDPRQMDLLKAAEGESC
jgi:hypothetical protein